MRKNIQLRGISHSPSSRVTQDGACAESLNMYLEDGELRPVFNPENIRTRFCNGDWEGKPLFIHKGNNYENLICLVDNSIVYYPTEKDEHDRLIFTFSVEEKLFGESKNWENVDITSIGNTLVISTGINIHYVLFTENTYLYLGTSIPKPNIFFYTKKSDKKIQSKTFKYAWHKDDIENQTKVLEIEAIFQNAKNELIRECKEEKISCVPVFVRYALKLYDGNYIHESVPIFLYNNYRVNKSWGPPIMMGGKDFFNFGYTELDPREGGAKGGVSINNLFEAFIDLKNCVEYNDKWKDIIQSIDVFLSTDIVFPNVNTRIVGYNDHEEGPIRRSRSNVHEKYAFAFGATKVSERRGLIKEEILSKSTFYKVMSINIDDKRLGKTISLFDNAKFKNPDLLVTSEVLPEPSNVYSDFHASSVESYNNRLMLLNPSYKISNGYCHLNGAVSTESAFNKLLCKCEYKFLLDKGVGKTLVIHNDLSEESAYIGNTWIAYPDPHCFAVIIKKKYIQSGTIEEKYYKMTKHPLLNCAYAYLGIDNKYYEGEVVHNFDSYQEHNIVNEPNLLWAAEMNNPFKFNATGILRFSSQVIATANATKPLSEGQFGQFPMYVFTNDGIYSIPISPTGSFLAQVPLSRDVALSDKSLLSMEQSVLFITKQGVKILTGSSISNISENMNGVYTMDKNLAMILSNTQLLRQEGKKTIFADDTTFVEYMKSAITSYDYVGRRILFFNPEKDYQYIFCLNSGTWHKHALLGKEYGTILGHINSYPDCFVVCDNAVDNKMELVNFSVFENSTKEQNTLPGLIVTRTMDLDVPDVRKTIKDIRLRGHYDKVSNLQYVLLGSMDGVNWCILSSLRGGSYKFFRIAVVANLEAGECFSYLEIDYDTKFMNKLR